MIKHYLEEMFEPTLLYGFSLAVIGVSAAIHYGYVSIGYGILAISGSVLAQMSVNVISDFFDYSSGLDKELASGKKDELGGGSKLLVKGLIKPRQTFILGLFIFTLAALIGIFLLTVRIQLLPILVIAAPSILLYSRYVKKVPYLAEPLCGFNYALIGLGCFIVVAGNAPLPMALLFLLAPAGIIIGSDTLYVNEVPDRKLDKKYGVRHSAVMLWTGKRIGLYYLLLQSIGYALIIIGSVIGFIPLLALAALVTVPATLYVFMGLYNDNSKKYSEYLAIHTIFSVILGLILCVSLLWGAVL